MKTQIHIRASKLTVNQIEKLLEKTGMTQTELISTAIDRLYTQEITMNTYYLTYSTDGFGDWNDTPADKIAATIQRYTEIASVAIEQQFPGVHVEPVENGASVKLNGSNPQGGFIDTWVDAHWVDWLEQATEEIG